MEWIRADEKQCLIQSFQAFHDAGAGNRKRWREARGQPQPTGDEEGQAQNLGRDFKSEEHAARYHCH